MLKSNAAVVFVVSAAALPILMANFPPAGRASIFPILAFSESTVRFASISFPSLFLENRRASVRLSPNVSAGGFQSFAVRVVRLTETSCFI